jgi:hypothetical protein
LAHDLKVIFTDLTLNQPQAAGPDVDSALMVWRDVFWPPRVFDAATDAGLLLNREMIEVVQRNLNASFSLLKGEPERSYYVAQTGRDPRLLHLLEQQLAEVPAKD